MKYLLFIGAFLLTGTAAVTTVKVLKNSPATVEATQFTSHTVTGNIVDERLVQPSAPTSPNKSVLKVKTNKSRVLYLNDEINFYTAQRTVNAIKRLNAESSEDIYLQIHSPGGSVLDGAMVQSEIEASKAHVITICTGLCASMAAMIHSYGYKRYSLDRAILMYHPASGGLQGQVPNMVSQLSTLTRYLDKIVANVTSRSKVTLAQYKELTAYELWIDSEDAVQKGLDDGIINLDVPSQEVAQVTLSESGQTKKHKSLIPPSEFKMMAPDSELYLWGMEPYAGQN